MDAPRPRLRVRAERLSIARLGPDEAWPVWALSAALVSLTRTEDELSVVCPEALVPPDARAERGWRAFHVEGPLNLGLVGVLAGLTSTLAARGIAVFAVSTFDTDLLLVRSERLEEAVQALRGAGYPVTEDQGGEPEVMLPRPSPDDLGRSGVYRSG